MTEFIAIFHDHEVRRFARTGRVFWIIVYGNRCGGRSNSQREAQIKAVWARRHRLNMKYRLKITFNGRANQ